MAPYKVPPMAVAKSLRLLRDEGSFSISETVIVIWRRCFWLFYCLRWQKKETEWISPLDFSDFTVCFCPFHFGCSIASYSLTFFHLKLLKYQICCSTCAPNLRHIRPKPPSTRQILHASLPLSAQMLSEGFQTAVYLL